MCWGEGPPKSSWSKFLLFTLFMSFMRPLSLWMTEDYLYPRPVPLIQDPLSSWVAPGAGCAEGDVGPVCQEAPGRRGVGV